MAYQADILINVKGFRDLTTIQKALEGTARKIDEVNKAAARMGAPVRNIERFTKQLQLAQKALSKVAIGSPQEQRAINNYVTALNNSNNARSRQNKLIQEEVQRRNSATIAIRANVEANIAESRTTRAAREEASRLNRELVERNRLERKLSKRGLMQLRGGGIARGTDAGFGLQGPAMPQGFMTRRATQAAARRTQAAAGAAQRERTQRLESLMLGVGFPLLFGGGPGEVAGGLLGSFGPGQGFGGQILGSAIGGMLFDVFVSSAGELGAALNPATADLDRLVDALGGVSTVTGQYIKKLEDLERSEEALAVATAELENLVGKRGVEALRAFGDDSTKLAGLFSQAMAQMQSGVIAFINSTQILRNLIEGLEYNVLLRQALTSQDPGQQALVQEREVAGRGALFGGDPGKFIQINNQLVAQQRQINNEKRKQYETSLELLTVEERQAEITKQTTKLAKELKSSYDEILKSAEDRIQKEQAAVDRGLSLSKARYEAELALNQLEQTRLERAYKYAQSQRERLDIAIAMFNTEVETAKLEYQQQLESIAAEERKLEIQLEQYRLAQETILLKADEARLAAELEPDAELRAASFKRIDETTARYLDKTREIIVEVEKQLAVQREIGEVQRQTAKTQLENKILAAQTRLEQKLVSEEIGLSENQALRLSNALAAAKQEAIFTAERGQQIVGVIEVGTQKTYIMAKAMSDVAAQAANAAAQIRAAVSAQNTLNAAKSGGGKSGGTVTRAAKGAYMSGGFQAFADGGMVNRPTLGLIGEGGESEYVVPASKAKGFSMRYLSGARGSAAIPTSGDGGSSSGPVNINIRTGPVMRQNGQNYVSVGDLEQALQTFADTMLKNNRTPGGRRYAGIG